MFIRGFKYYVGRGSRIRVLYICQNLDIVCNRIQMQNLFKSIAYFPWTQPLDRYN